MNWFINLKTRTKLFLGFGLINLLLIGTVITVLGILEHVQRDYSLAVDAVQLQNNISAQRMSLLRMTAVTDRAQQDSELAALKNLQGISSRLMGQVKERGDGVLTSHIAAWAEGLEEYNKVLSGQLIPAILAGRQEEARAQAEGDLADRFEKLRSLGEEVSKINRGDTGRAEETAVKMVSGFGIVAVLIGVLLALLLNRIIARPLVAISRAAEQIALGDLEFGLIMENRSDEVGILANAFGSMTASLREMIRQVQKSGIQVTTSGTEIAATAREQQATASEISSTTTEIGATAKEISATSKELVKAMKSVTGIAEETAALASDGQNGLTRMEDTMSQIMEASGAINARLAVLSEKAGNINKVVTTITKVADQTNLLSLNAAIEAEKAGEYGRGFAVVATEIRRLADQTAAATADIEQIVKEMQSAVSAGVMGMDKFSEEVRRGAEVVSQVGTQLSAIIGKVQTLTPSFETVNEGMHSQALGAQQISEALMQLGEAAQQTVETLIQSNQAIRQLNDVTATLQSSVSRFKVTE